MSTSPSRAADAETVRAPAAAPFPYDRVASAGEGHLGLDLSSGAALGGGEAASREKQAFAQGVREGRAAAQKAFEDQLATARSGIAAALSQFTRDRAGYFEKVEGEVVQLALSIARKILHREAQLDPMLLAGIVRVALEKIEGASGVVLHVHPQNADDWRRYFALQLNPADLPQMVEDSSQGVDTCMLETVMGTATLGLDIQLKEIERGLMDLLAARPGATS